MAKLIEKESEYESFSRIKLFRDNLDHILRVMGAIAPPKITSGEYEYESLDEVAQEKGDWVESLTFHSRRNGEYATFCIDRDSASLHVGRNKPVFSDLRDFLRQRSSSVWPSVLVVFVACPILVFSLIFIAKPSGMSAAWLVPISALMGAGATQAAFYLSKTKISLARAHEYRRERFWEKHKDKLVIAVLSAVLGAVLKSGVDWLSKPAISPQVEQTKSGN